MLPVRALLLSELARLQSEMEKTQGEIKRIEGKLNNQGFVAKAPEAVVAKEREKLAGYQETLVKLEEQKSAISAL